MPIFMFALPITDQTGAAWSAADHKNVYNLHSYSHIVHNIKGSQAAYKKIRSSVKFRKFRGHLT